MTHTLLDDIAALLAKSPVGRMWDMAGAWLAAGYLRIGFRCRAKRYRASVRQHQRHAAKARRRRAARRR
jgi:hypothetical protein